MQSIYDETAPKKSANLSINSNLLKKARNFDINLSATLEQALEAELRKSIRERWHVENKTAIENCNAIVDRHGLFADKHRGF